MKLSIVIPVYRVEDTLDRCVESVLGQTFTDLEVILVDDGSPDECPRMCDAWARRDHRIRVIHKENGGLSDARNAGINVAQGDYITFVDSDDFIGKTTYEEVMPLAEQADIVEYAIYRYDGSNSKKMIPLPEKSYDDMQDYWLKGKAYLHTYACNKIFSRQLFGNVCFPVGRVFEDAATLPLLLSKTRRVTTTGRGCYYYCANNRGITARATGKELAQLLESHVDTLHYWQDETYYMHVLNIQLDVCEQTGRAPILPNRRIHLSDSPLDYKHKLKALMINLIGIKGLCTISKLYHRLTGHRS